MKASILIILAGLFATGLALAHDDAYLDTLKAPNGGQLRMAGPYHFELVVVSDIKDAKDNPVLVYLTDHAANKVASGGTKGTATMLAGKRKTTLQLTPDGDNRLKGMGSYASDPAMKVVVSVTFADGKTEQARFEPLVKKTADVHAEHKH